MSMGWFARCCTVNEPSRFWADCAQADDATNIPKIAAATQVPVRTVRLLAKKSITHPISMERGAKNIES